MPLLLSHLLLSRFYFLNNIIIFPDEMFSETRRDVLWSLDAPLALFSLDLCERACSS